MKDLPLNQWMRVRVRDEYHLVFALDTPEQPLVRGEALKSPTQSLSVSMVYRLMNTPGQSILANRIIDYALLTTNELRAAQLGPRPNWAPADPNQPPLWRQDQRLSTHPEDPDECEVLFHDFEKRKTELLWVKLGGHDHDNHAYTGTLLNDPTLSYPGLHKDNTWSVRATQGSPIPFLLTDQMKRNLAQWTGHCEQCGFDLMCSPWQTHSPIEHLENHTTPPHMLTVPCVMCRGTMLMLLKS